MLKLAGLNKELKIKSDKNLLNQEVYYVTVLDSAKNIFKNEGIKGFYKGLIPNLAKIFPSSGVFFLIYEATLKYFE